MSEMPAAEKQYLLRAMPGFDDQLLKVLWETMTKNGGLQTMDRDVLKAFYDEFERRPGLLESMTNESKRRSKMRLTESQLRKIIRKRIKESMGLPPMDLELMRKLYDWVAINEDIGDPLPFLATIDTFMESEADAGNPMDGMEEEIHQALNDLIDTEIVSKDNFGQGTENLGLSEYSWDSALLLLKEKGLL